MRTFNVSLFVEELPIMVFQLLGEAEAQTGFLRFKKEAEWWFLTLIFPEGCKYRKKKTPKAQSKMYEQFNIF